MNPEDYEELEKRAEIKYLAEYQAKIQARRSREEDLLKEHIVEVKFGFWFWVKVAFFVVWLGSVFNIASQLLE